MSLKAFLNTCRTNIQIMLFPLLEIFYCLILGIKRKYSINLLSIWGYYNINLHINS